MEEIEKEIKRISQQSTNSYATTVNVTVQFLSKIENTEELWQFYEILKLRQKENTDVK